MTIEASGGWWMAASLLAVATTLTLGIAYAAGWVGRKKGTPVSTVSTTAPAAAATPASPAGNSSGGATTGTIKKFPWGWVKLIAAMLAVIFVWLYAWPQWIDPLLRATILIPRPNSTAEDSRHSAAGQGRQVVVYHRQVPDGGSITAPVEGDEWSEPISYHMGLELCWLEERKAGSVAAQMQIVGSEVWRDQPSLTRAEMRRVMKIRFRSLDGESQRVTYNFIPAQESC